MCGGAQSGQLGNNGHGFDLAALLSGAAGLGLGLGAFPLLGAGMPILGAVKDVASNLLAG